MRFVLLCCATNDMIYAACACTAGPEIELTGADIFVQHVYKLVWLLLVGCAEIRFTPGLDLVGLLF